MAENNKPLTAEDIYTKNTQPIYNGVMGVVKGKFIKAMEEYAAQETAALREELEHVKADRRRYTEMFLSEKGLREQAERIYNTEHAELEAVKKERAEWINEGQKVMLQRDEVTRQRDEVVELLHDVHRYYTIPEDAHYRKRFFNLLSRLSSGETKPSFFTLERCLEVFNNGFTCGIMNKIGHAGYERDDVTDRMRVSLIKEINPLNNLSN